MTWITIGNTQIAIPSFLKTFFPYKEKKLFWIPNNKILYLLLQNKISILVINWMFQGVFGLSKIDLIGKILLELCMFLTLIISFSNLTVKGVIFSLLFAHTMNWIFNTHFWDIGRYIGFTRTDTGRFYPYLKNIFHRISAQSSLIGAIVIGGASRGEGIKNTSDIDLYFISEKGIKNNIFSFLISVKERSLAFVNKFPLNLCLADDLTVMSKHRNDETPFILFDPQNKVKEFYQKQNRNTASLDDYAGAQHPEVQLFFAQRHGESTSQCNPVCSVSLCENLKLIFCKFLKRFEKNKI